MTPGTEKGADLQITGTSDQPVGTAITVTLNGQNYAATTDASGNWSVTVPASAVTALGQANYTVTAAVTSSIGNSATASHNVLVDSALQGVTINPVASDDIVNAAEAGVAQIISGQGDWSRRWRHGNRHAWRYYLHHHRAGQFKLERERSGGRYSGVG